MLDNIQPPKLNNMNNGLCQYDGCKSIATENGSKLFCHAHGGRRICCHAGCQNLAQAQGVCITHGWKKKRCSVDGCEKQSQSKNGMCKTHGGQNYAPSVAVDTQSMYRNCADFTSGQGQ